jgi:ribose transport system substrate-binding protein
MKDRIGVDGLRRVPLVVFVALIVIASAGILSACGGGSDGESGTTGAEGSSAEGGRSVSPIAFFATGAANSYVQATFEAAKAEAERRGLEIELVDGEFDPTVQEKQIQDAITSGQFNSFIIQANDGAGIAPVVKEAIEAGYNVAAYGTPIGPDPTIAEPQVEGVITTTSEDVETGAKVTAEGIVQACEGIDPCKVALLWGNRGVAYEAAKVSVVESILGKHDNIKVVAQTDAGFLRDQGRDAIQDALTANPDLNVVASASGDQMIAGAQQAIEDAGGEVGPGKVVLIGYGGSATAQQRIEDGEWLQTYPIEAQTMAVEDIAALDKHAKGEKVKAAINQWELAPIGKVVNQATLKANPGWNAQWDG